MKWVFMLGLIVGFLIALVLYKNRMFPKSLGENDNWASLPKVEFKEMNCNPEKLIIAGKLPIGFYRFPINAPYCSEKEPLPTE
jgi:hypothetical protein